jgi:hypothetical protein
MLHGAKPALEILLADGSAQPLLHTRPSFLITEAHRPALMRNDGAADGRGGYNTRRIVRECGC